LRRIQLLGGTEQLRHRQPHLLAHVRGEFPGRKSRVLVQSSRRGCPLILLGAERLEHERRHNDERREQKGERRHATTRPTG
jgi:hypothetical protein